MATKNSKKNQENILFLLMGIIILGLVVAGFILFKKQFSDIFNDKNNPNATQITAQTEPLQTNNESIKKEVKEEEYIPQEEVQN
ncbi:MAG: hypothetical protein J6Z11_02900, partial [Candidatus Riflebacteria bacterium]|nr:hypothetical protein [Candidatus Riflebacteria bacterium]